MSNDFTDLLQIITRIFAVVMMANYIRLKHIKFYRVDWVLAVYVVLYSYGVFYVGFRLFDTPLKDNQFLKDLIIPTQIVAALMLGLWFANGEFNTQVYRAHQRAVQLWLSMTKRFHGS